MNEKINKNVKVKKLTKKLRRGERLIVIDPYYTPATKLGGYTGITLSVRPSVRL